MGSNTVSWFGVQGSGLKVGKLSNILPCRRHCDLSINVQRGPFPVHFTVDDRYRVLILKNLNLPAVSSNLLSRSQI